MLLTFMVYSCCLSLKVLPESKGAICCFARLFLRGQFAVRLPLLLAEGGFFMSESRVAVLSIIVEDTERSEKLNAILHDFGEYIIGSGYDWTAYDLEDVTIDIDYSKADVTFIVNEWEMTIDMEVEI